MKKFHSYDDTYQAIEDTIRDMRQLPNIHSHTQFPSKFEYLYNPITKKAILLKIISKTSRKSLFVRKSNRRSRIQYDTAKRIITTKTGFNEVLGFFREEQFRGYELVVSCGSLVHDSCLFLRKTSDGIDVVYFNPNRSSVQQSVQYSQRIDIFLKQFGRKVTLHSCENDLCVFNMNPFCLA